jgi:hypothetical protein
MGSQGDKPQAENAITFSSDLHRGLRQRLGTDRFDRLVRWREIFWSDILQERQQDYMTRALEGEAHWMRSRDFVMHRLADAAAYRWEKGEHAYVYPEVHARVRAAIAHLEQMTGGGAPLIVLAHSLGGHVISNHIWDLQEEHSDAPTAFQRFETMAAFVTFGCNIPIFTFSCPPGRVKAINRPGKAIPPEHRFRPWWVNLNSRNDILGMPLAQAGEGYAALAQAGELQDRWISAGGPLTAWNPLSHNAYWKDGDVHSVIRTLIERAMRIGPVA